MKYYFKNNIQFAPYLWNWYAWSHLISPHTAASNIAERHIAIMESFIEAPELHFEAINSRGMIGGPFINLDPHEVGKVKDLLAVTKNDCESLLQLHHDIKEFNRMLREEALGASMENMYARLPHTLKGIVELVYDLNSKPQIRFIEALVYAKYYDTKHQTICFAEIKNDNRAFCLSTPFIDNEATVQLPIPFASPVIDKLVQMQTIPGSLDEILEVCNVPAAKLELFRSFFTTAAPATKPSANNCVDDVKIRYFGHACILLQTPAFAILVDPTLGYNFDGSREDRFSFADLPDKIDYVLITHNHQDHFLFETLLQLRQKIGTMVVPSSNNGSHADPSLKIMLKHLGFDKIITIDEFDDIQLGAADNIIALPFLGEHGDLNIHSKRAYYISLRQKSFLFLADSNNLDADLYQHILDRIGRVDIIFIGMECVGAPVSWLYGPLFPTPLGRDHDKSRRLSGSNFDKAWKIIQLFDCEHVYVYAMGMEPWLNYIMAIHYQENSPPILESNKLVAKCVENNIAAKRLYGKEEWVF
jgi:L-ascorbate metabolism protein UlaG (beta-lactamase superfamily)